VYAQQNYDYMPVESVTRSPRSRPRLMCVALLINDLTVVTRNTTHYRATGVQVLNPFV
jgi:hypothetical protein